MPLYEYECTSCHRRTEKIQKFSDADLTICPHCSGPLERTLTAPNIQFKGGGWYKDLYSSVKPAASGDSSGGAASSDSGSGSDSSGKSGSEGSGASASSSGDSAKSGDTAKPAAAPSTSPAASPASSATTKA